MTGIKKLFGMETKREPIYMAIGRRFTNYQDIINMKWNRIGFGTWPLSGDKNGSISYGKVDENESPAPVLSTGGAGSGYIGMCHA